MRLPVASGASSGGRVAVVELSTMPGTDAAAAGPAGATRAAPAASRAATTAATSKRGLVFMRTPFVRFNDAAQRMAIATNELSTQMRSPSSPVLEVQFTK